jgi:hypothetical protein
VLDVYHTVNVPESCTYNIKTCYLRIVDVILIYVMSLCDTETSVISKVLCTAAIYRSTDAQHSHIRPFPLSRRLQHVYIPYAQCVLALPGSHLRQIRRPNAEGSGMM